MDDFLAKLSNEFHLPFHNSVLVFTIILGIILLSPIILRKIKIPGIIVLIISGIFIGPQGFNMIERNEAVVLFSTIGLLYIMFLAGLDLDLDEFAKNRHKSILFGFFTFSIPLLLGFPICYYFFEYNFISSLLIASMFATHTLIAYPIVSKLDITRNEAVAITVGGTIITDTAVLVILALITGAQQGALDAALWGRLGVSFALFFLFMFYLVPMVARWFFKKLENEKYSHYIFVLATVFFSAFMAELASLEPIIGAFAAGLVLNRLIPKTSPLMSRIEFVGNALFIPFFLISIGMIVNVDALKNGSWALVVAVVLSASALVGKYLAASITSFILKYSSAQRMLIFGLSSSHAVATLAVIAVGYRMNIIDEHVFNGTIILILVTCVVATLVTESAARKIAITEEHGEQSLSNASDERLLVPISNPKTMIRLIDLALSFSTKKNNVPVYGLAIVRDNEQLAQRLSQSKRILSQLISHAAETDRKLEVISTIDQNIANGIRRVTKEISATDILIGISPQTKLADVIFGKLMDHIINSTSQTVFIYNPVIAPEKHKNIRVICPQYSAKEFGFSQWLSRVISLSKNISAKCWFYCEMEPIVEIMPAFKMNKMSTLLHVTSFVNAEELNASISLFESPDLLVLVYPRKGSISYNSGLAKTADMLDREFLNSSYLIVAPCVKDVPRKDSFIQASSME